MSLAHSWSLFPRQYIKTRWSYGRTTAWAFPASLYLTPLSLDRLTACVCCVDRRTRSGAQCRPGLGGLNAPNAAVVGLCLPSPSCFSRSSLRTIRITWLLLFSSTDASRRMVPVNSKHSNTPPLIRHPTTSIQFGCPSYRFESEEFAYASSADQAISYLELRASSM